MSRNTVSELPSYPDVRELSSGCRGASESTASLFFDYVTLWGLFTIPNIQIQDWKVVSHDKLVSKLDWLHVVWCRYNSQESSELPLLYCLYMLSLPEAETDSRMTRCLTQWTLYFIAGVNGLWVCAMMSKELFSILYWRRTFLSCAYNIHTQGRGLCNRVYAAWLVLEAQNKVLLSSYSTLRSSVFIRLWKDCRHCLY